MRIELSSFSPHSMSIISQVILGIELFVLHAQLLGKMYPEISNVYSSFRSEKMCEI